MCSPDGYSEIARRFDSGTPGDEFWTALSKDIVTEKILARLAPLCPCQLEDNVPERSWLIDLFLGRLNDDEVSRIRRRHSLGLILHLVREIAADPNSQIDAMTFRDACYTGSLPNHTQWIIPDALAAAREGWRLYQRNELLSVSAQALLTIFVRSLELVAGAPQAPEQVAALLLKEPPLRRVARLGWREFASERGKGLPPLEKSDSPNHELKLVQDLFELDTGDGPLPELADGVRCVAYLLAALQNRPRSGVTPYGDLPISESLLADYPINLSSFEHSVAIWSEMNVGQVVEWLIREWACETHLRIALRKLRYERLDTFRFYPTETGLKPREVPPFGYSNPRVAQAIQILRDLGGLQADDRGRFQITKVGRDWLEEICRS